MSHVFEELPDGGTHFEVRFAKPRPKDLPFFERIWPNVQKKFTRKFQILRAVLAEEAKATAEELPPPVSRERFRTPPAHAR